MTSLERSPSLTREQLAAVLKRAVLFHQRNGTVEMVEEGLIRDGQHPAVAHAVAAHFDGYMAARKKRLIGMLLLLGGVGLSAILLMITLTGIAGSGRSIFLYGVIAVGIVLFAAGGMEVAAVSDRMVEATTSWDPPAL